jgi:hypothetical protein
MAKYSISGGRGRFLLYTGIICAIFAVSKSSEKVSFEKYLDWGYGFRGTSVYETYNKKSLVECTLICKEMSECISFNIDVKGTCEINNKPFDYYNSYIRENSSWRFFEKGNCRLGRKLAKRCLMLLHTGGSSWNESREICQRGHGDLVKIMDDDENGATLKLLLDTFHGEVPKIWIGLNKIQSDNFVWPDKTGMNINYPGDEPNLANDCVAVTHANSTYIWGSEDCSSKMAFLCEKRNAS